MIHSCISLLNTLVFPVVSVRYKPLCSDTWPSWKGTDAEGVECLIKHLGYTYKRTKIFIRHPRTLFATEEAFEVCKHELGGYWSLSKRQRSEDISKDKGSTSTTNTPQNRLYFVIIFCRFIKGFMTRNQPACVDNTEYLALVRQIYLIRLKENLPKTVLDKNTWLTPPPIMQKASQMSRKLYTQHILRKYVQGITGRPTLQLQIKGLTSSLFKGRKENYPHNVCRPFVDTRISEEDIHIKAYQMILSAIPSSVPVVKYDRNGFRPRFRQLIYTGTAAYLVEEAKIKQHVEFNNLKGVSVSNLSDNFLILHIQCEDIKQKVGCAKLLFNVVVVCSVKFDIQPGREGIVDFESGQETNDLQSKEWPSDGGEYETERLCGHSILK
uniref:TH1 domain-containing protein n=1 Tax=Salmo trutta TaxID=8032 RepID=A0A673WD74_SALTR